MNIYDALIAKALSGGGSGGSGGGGGGDSSPAGIPRVEISSSSAALDPNKFYVFPEMASLTITLATPSDSTIVNEYHFRFDSGDTATTLSLPNDVTMPADFAVEADMTYEISIIDNMGLVTSWEYTPPAVVEAV